MIKNAGSKRDVQADVLGMLAGMSGTRCASQPGELREGRPGVHRTRPASAHCDSVTHSPLTCDFSLVVGRSCPPLAFCIFGLRAAAVVALTVALLNQ
jgi:hypothetical protein